MKVENAQAGTVNDWFFYDVNDDIWNGSSYVDTSTISNANFTACRVAARESSPGRFVTTNVSDVDLTPANAVRYELRFRAATWEDGASYVVANGEIVEFPANFGDLVITGAGAIAAVQQVESVMELEVGAINSGSFAANAITAAALATDAVSEIAAAISGGVTLASGTVASTTGTTTTLDTGAAATADYYNGAVLVITAGTGIGQERVITAYSAGRVAIHAAWTTNPTGSSTYAVLPARVSGATDAIDVPTVQEIVSALGGAAVQYNGPVADDGAIELFAGDDYTGGKALVWTITGYAGVNVGGETLTFTLMQKARFDKPGGMVDLSVSGSVTQSGTTVTITVALTAAQTLALLTFPPHDEEHYQAQGQTVTTQKTLIYAPCTVRKRVGNST